MTMFIFAYLAVGCITGVLAGLFGIGGGIISVPILTWLFTWQGFAPDSTLIMAIASSLAAIIFTALASVRAHQRLGAMQWSIVYQLSVPIGVGAAMGAGLAEAMPVLWLRHILVGFLFYVAILMAFSRKKSTKTRVNSRYLDTCVGWFIGVISALVGIGGGTLTVPYLLLRQLPMAQVVALSSACGLPIAIVGSMSYALLGWQQPDLPWGSVGYVFLPAMLSISLSSIITAPVGAKWANKLPSAQLKRYFSVLLVLMAAKLLWAG